MPHRSRAELLARFPIHVTLRARSGLPSLRQEGVLRALHACLRRATARGHRIVHFSLQIDHLHLLLEAGNADALARLLKGLASITARTFNRALGRSGPLWLERYHRHDMRTPTQVHRAIAYVLHNFRKHARTATEREERARTVDPYSSAPWFDGWDEAGRAAAEAMRRILTEHRLSRCTAEPRTFLLAKGYAKLGAIAFAPSQLRADG